MPDIISSAMSALRNIHTIDGPITQGMRGITRFQTSRWFISVFFFFFRFFHAAGAGWRWWGHLWHGSIKRMCRKQTKAVHFPSVTRIVTVCPVHFLTVIAIVCRMLPWFLCLIGKRNTQAGLRFWLNSSFLPVGMRRRQTSHTCVLFCHQNISASVKTAEAIYKIKEASGKKDLPLPNKVEIRSAARVSTMRPTPRKSSRDALPPVKAFKQE